MSDYEDVVLPLIEENERLKRENKQLVDKLEVYLNKNNDLWNRFIREGRMDAARGE